MFQVSRLTTNVIRISQRKNLPRLISANRFYCDKKEPEKSAEIKIEKDLENQQIEAKLSGFAKAFQKFSEPTKEEAEETPATFESLLKNSKFIEVSFPC